MSNYRRNRVHGGCYFFTVVTWQRAPIFADESNIALLRHAFKKVKQTRPFDIDAVVILPDHLHCLWQLPLGDSDFSGRWREIKKLLSKQLSHKQNQRKENLIWQRRFWEHTICDENDWKAHLDYIHYNPVKHGLVQKPSQWAVSSFLKCVEKGWYDIDWGKNVSEELRKMDLE